MDPLVHASACAQAGTPAYQATITVLKLSKDGRWLGKLPPTANDVRRMHWREQARETTEWNNATVTALCQAYPDLLLHVSETFWERQSGKSWRDTVLLPPAVMLVRPPVFPKATVLCVRYSSGSGPDYDGLVRSFKPILDGLVLCGIVADDKPSILWSRFWWRKSKFTDQHIELMIFPGHVALSDDAPAAARATEGVLV